MNIISDKNGVKITMTDDEFKTLNDLVRRGAMSTSLCGYSEEDMKKKDIFDMFNLIKIS